MILSSLGLLNTRTRQVGRIQLLAQPAIAWRIRPIPTPLISTGGFIALICTHVAHERIQLSPRNIETISDNTSKRTRSLSS